MHSEYYKYYKVYINKALVTTEFGLNQPKILQENLYKMCFFFDARIISLACSERTKLKFIHSAQKNKEPLIYIDGRSCTPGRCIKVYFEGFLFPWGVTGHIGEGVT